MVIEYISEEEYFEKKLLLDLMKENSDDWDQISDKMQKPKEEVIKLFLQMPWKHEVNTFENQ